MSKGAVLEIISSARETISSRCAFGSHRLRLHWISRHQKQIVLRKRLIKSPSHNPSPSHSDWRRQRSVAILKSLLSVLATKGSDRRLFLQALGSYCVQALGPSLESISCRRHLATHHIIFISACESGFMTYCLENA